jgi:hypothetical protein
VRFCRWISVLITSHKLFSRLHMTCCTIRSGRQQQQMPTWDFVALVLLLTPQEPYVCHYHHQHKGSM